MRRRSLLLHVAGVNLVLAVVCITLGVLTGRAFPIVSGAGAFAAGVYALYVWNETSARRRAVRAYYRRQRNGGSPG